MKTVLLTRSEVEPLLHLPALLPMMRQAFQAYSLQRSLPAQRVRSLLPGQSVPGAMLLFPGLLPSIPAYTVKVHAKFPTQQPAIKGVLLLHDLQTGDLLAVMDSTAITAVRTGLAGAVAADVLARPDAFRVALIGAGAQGKWQLRSLALVRQLSQVLVYDIVAERAEAFACAMDAELPFAVRAAPSLAEATKDAEIIVTATWSREPFLLPYMVRLGTHITTLGPDEPGKCEVAAELLQQSLFICDDRDLAISMGTIESLGLDEQAVHAELGEVIAGEKAGRSSAEQITIYDGVGLAFQDLVTCWYVYQQVVEGGKRRSLDFLS